MDVVCGCVLKSNFVAVTFNRFRSLGFESVCAPPALPNAKEDPAAEEMAELTRKINFV